MTTFKQARRVGNIVAQGEALGGFEPRRCSRPKCKAEIKKGANWINALRVLGNATKTRRKSIPGVFSAGSIPPRVLVAFPRTLSAVPDFDEGYLLTPQTMNLVNVQVCAKVERNR